MSFLPTYLDRAYGAKGLDGCFLWGRAVLGKRGEVTQLQQSGLFSKNHI